MKKIALAAFLLSLLYGSPFLFSENASSLRFGLEAGGNLDIPLAMELVDGTGSFPGGAVLGIYLGDDVFGDIFVNLKYDSFEEFGAVSTEAGVRRILIDGLETRMELSFSGYYGYRSDFIVRDVGIITMGSIASLGMAWDLGGNLSLVLSQGLRVGYDLDAFSFAFPTLMSCRYQILEY